MAETVVSTRGKIMSRAYLPTHFFPLKKKFVLHSTLQPSVKVDVLGSAFLHFWSQNAPV